MVFIDVSVYLTHTHKKTYKYQILYEMPSHRGVDDKVDIKKNEKGIHFNNGCVNNTINVIRCEHTEGGGESARESEPSTHPTVQKIK